MTTARSLHTVNDGAPTRTVTTTGLGRATAAPDTALINLGVEHVAPSPADALSACGASTAAVLAAVQEHVPEAGDIQTSDLSVMPHWDHRGDGPAGYAARTTLIIRTRRLDDAGLIAAAALQAAGDAGQIHTLSLIVADAGAAVDEARAAAFADARRKASQYADLAGATLGELLHLSEGGGAGQPQRFEMVATLAASAAPPPIEPGQSQLAVTVTAVWALIDQ